MKKKKRVSGFETATFQTPVIYFGVRVRGAFKRLYLLTKLGPDHHMLLRLSHPPVDSPKHSNRCGRYAE